MLKPKSFRGPCPLDPGGGGHSILGNVPCSTKKTLLFSLAFTERPLFSPTCTQWPPISNKLLVTQRPWHIFVTQRPFIFAFNSQTSDNFQQKIGFFKNFDKFDKMLRHFWPFSALKARIFLMHFIERPPIFVRFVTEKPPFLTQCVTERPLHLRCLVALVRHFLMWVPPRDPGPPPGLCPWTPPVALERALSGPLDPTPLDATFTPLSWIVNITRFPAQY